MTTAMAETTSTTTAEAQRRQGEGGALSWPEVQEICHEIEALLRKDAQKDAQRLRELIRKRKELTATCQSTRTEAQRQLTHLLQSVGEWEQQTQNSKSRKEALDAKLQELDALKQEMIVQLEAWRLNEQSSNESLQQLLDQYEVTRQEVVAYEQEHRQAVDRAKHYMSLYAAVTGIRWDFSSDPTTAIAGEIHVPNTKCIVPFELEMASSVDAFELANRLWETVDAALDPQTDPDL